MKYPRNILVQGAAGFVGKSLVPMLLEKEGIEKITLVDLKPIDITNYEKINKHIELLSITTDSLLSNQKIGEQDLVISLAGSTNVDEALEKPKKAFDLNLKIAVDLGEWIRVQSRKPTLLFISSDEVLGESFSPLAEDSPINPTQPYAVSKAVGEIILQNYSTVYGEKVVILRTCNLIGPNIRARKLLPVAINSIFFNMPIKVYGDGSARREWMDVDDFCGAIDTLVTNNISEGIFQASSGLQFSVNEVIEIIKEELNVSVECEMGNFRKINDRCYSSSTEKLRSLGWFPKKNPRTSIADVARLLFNINIIKEFEFEK
jgi:dTDP-glucose 4,6-dehydratase